MRSSLAFTVVVAALLGCVAYVALLPWGDPCSLTVSPGEAGCSILLSPGQQNIRNVLFFGLTLLIGLAGGFMSPSPRYLAGALSSPLAVLLAIFSTHLVYGLRSPFFRMDIPGAYVSTLELSVALIVLGAIGAAIGRYIRLTIVGGGRGA